MDEWQLVQFEDVVELQRGHDLPASERNPGDVPVIGSFGITGTHDRAAYDGPGVAIGRSGAAIGTATYVAGAYWPLNTCLFVKDFKGNDSQWVFRLLQTIDFTGFNSGSAQPSLNRNFLKNIPVLRPPVTVQRSIASILAALDDKLTVNDRIAQALLDLAGTLFLEAVAANESRMLTIGELADIRAIEFSDGYRTKKIEHGRPGLRILRAGDVRDSYLYPSGGDYVSSDYSRQIGSKASRPGDIVLTTKGTVGRVAVVADAVEPVVYSPQVCFFRVTDACQVDPGYLSGWFRSDDLQRQAATLMNKSDMAPYVSLRDVRSLTLPLLSISDQRRCGEVQNSLITIFEATRIENDRLVRTRDQLLPLLMSGKLAVRTAESIVEEMV